MVLFRFVFTVVIHSRRISSANITQSTPELIFATVHGTNCCSYLRSVFIQKPVAASTVSLGCLHFACWTLFSSYFMLSQLISLQCFLCFVFRSFPLWKLESLWSEIYSTLYVLANTYGISQQKGGRQGLDLLQDGWIGLFFFFWHGLCHLMGWSFPFCWWYKDLDWTSRCESCGCCLLPRYCLCCYYCCCWYDIIATKALCCVSLSNCSFTIEERPGLEVYNQHGIT